MTESTVAIKLEMAGVHPLYHVINNSQFWTFGTKRNVEPWNFTYKVFDHSLSYIIFAYFTNPKSELDFLKNVACHFTSIEIVYPKCNCLHLSNVISRGRTPIVLQPLYYQSNTWPNYLQSGWMTGCFASHLAIWLPEKMSVPL